MSELIAKVRSLVHCIRNSQIYTHELKTRARKLPRRTLVVDCPTRWNSILYMIESVFELRGVLFEMYQAVVASRSKTELPRTLLQFFPSDTEWIALRDIALLLRPLARCTTVAEGETYVSISVACAMLFSQVRLDWNALDPASGVCSPGISKVSSSQGLDLLSVLRLRFFDGGNNARFHSLGVLGKLPLLACLLDPRTGLRFHSLFGKAVKPSAIDALITELRWLSDVDRPEVLQQSETRGASAAAAAAASTSATGGLDDIPADNACEAVSISTQERLLVVLREETMKYCSLPDAPSFATDPLQWWRSRSSTYPHLSALAKLVLAVPASSAATERVFSTGNNIVRRNRARLRVDSVRLIVLCHERKRAAERSSRIHFEIPAWPKIAWLDAIPSAPLLSAEAPAIDPQQVLTAAGPTQRTLTRFSERTQVPGTRSTADGEGVSGGDGKAADEEETGLDDGVADFADDVALRPDATGDEDCAQYFGEAETENIV